MSDFGGAPVGTTVNPVGQGLQTLQDVLNVKRSQQALQTGVYQQQSAQAAAQQDQQKNQELQALSAFTKNATKDSAYHNPDGSLNVQKFQNDAQAVAPVYGQAYIGQMTANANAMVDNRKALLSLSNEQRKTIGNYFGAVAAKPNATGQDFMDAVEQARGVSDDPSYQRSVDRMLMGAPHIATLPTEQVSGVIRNYSRGIAMQTSAPDASESAPNVSMVQGPSGLVPTNTNPQAPGGVAPVGPTQAQGVAPQVTTTPQGNIGVVRPSGAVTVTGQGAGPSASTSKLPPMQRPGVNAPAADQANYNARIQQLGQEYQGVSSAANDPMNGVQSTRFRNQQILDLIPHATTGPGLRMLNLLASRLPGASGDAYQDLEHYLSQNSAAMAKTMGVPSTNLGAETAAAAAGNVERNPGALREITRTNDALNTAMDLYNRGFAKVTNNGSDMSRAASYKQAFGQSLDVNALRWADAHRRRDQQEIEDLTKKLGPQGIKAAQQKLLTLKSLSDKGDLP